MTYDYDMVGGRIHQRSVDAGERWMLNNATRKPQRNWDWDSRDLQIRQTRHIYDPLRRPTNLFVQTGSGAEQLAEQTVYGEGQPGDQQLNLRGMVFQQFDGAGVVTNNAFDFKGNLKSSTRQLLQNYKDQMDWSQAPPLEGETFTGSTMFDALNRTIQLVAPKSSDANAKFNIVQPVYNEANLLERLATWLGQPGAPQGVLDPSTANFHPVTNIDYNAKGQRELVEYDNGVQTRYEYDPQTFRITRLKTTRASDGVALQDLTYTYDPVGNITHLQDDADIQNTVYFNNQRVDPSSDYVYDAIYRLTSSAGRELIGLLSQPWTTYDDSPRMGQILPTNGLAMQNYSETYRYDWVGNLSALSHAASNFTWTRTYGYDEPNIPPRTTA